MSPKTVLMALLIILAVNTTASGQEALRDPDEFLVKGDSLPKVLLVGSFHFAYYGLDAHKTSEDERVNVLSPAKQEEMEELVNYIAKFKPTKLVIENQGSIDEVLDRYQQYKEGKEELKANEIDQICFRLMNRFDIDTLYGADTWGITTDLRHHKDSAVFGPWLDELFEDYDFKSDDEINQRYFDWYDYNDELALELSLLDYFKIMNSEKYIKRNHGAYLVGDFKLGKYRGADAMLLMWYSRNLRIFRNIQTITTSPADRIMVLFGSGHLSILKQQFESSPEFQLISFNELE